MTYPFSYPLARWVSKLGITLTIRINVVEDSEAGVYVATSPDIEGLVIESETFHGLRQEINEAIPNLLALQNKHRKTEADLIFRDHIAIA